MIVAISVQFATNGHHFFDSFSGNEVGPIGGLLMMKEAAALDFDIFHLLGGAVPATPYHPERWESAYSLMSISIAAGRACGAQRPSGEEK